MDMVLVLVFLTGLCFGSFATLASYRLPLSEGIVRGASRCPSCATRLQARDLLPALSWVASCGRCRHCKAKVHWRYPVIELACAAAFTAIYLMHGLNAASVLLMLAATALLIMIVADFEHFIIPDEVHIALLPLGIGYRLLTGGGVEIAAGVGLGLLIGLSLKYGYKVLRKKEGLGTGDVKFLAVAGVWLDIMAFPIFLLLSGLLGIAIGLSWRAAGRGRYFPFGPALALALFICILWPQAMTLWP